jgi:hypothetical protein
MIGAPERIRTPGVAFEVPLVLCEARSILRMVCGPHPNVLISFEVNSAR